MSWRDEYQQGSFRGVPFRTETASARRGRRVARHEFPGRDEPVVEDLGRRAREFQIDCHVIGADYRTQRDALLDALEAPGPGLLVHPWHGRMMVVVLDAEDSESTEEGGLCRFRITFGEAGLAAPAPVEVAAGADGEQAADEAIEGAPEELAKSFSIEEAAAFVEQAAADLVEGMAFAAQVSAAMRGGVGAKLRAFEAGLRFLPANVSSLLRAPLDLGHALVGLVQAVAVLPSQGRRTRLAPLEMMLDWEPSQPAMPERTPQRRREADNRRALLHLFRTVSAAELVRAASTIDYASYEDARATRDAVSERLDALALAAADRGNDNAAQVFDRLRLALHRDIAARGQTLARVHQLEIAQTEPALVLVHRLYGNRPARGQAIEARAAEIVARNRVKHPGFIPAGSPISVLTDPADAATARGLAA